MLKNKFLRVALLLLLLALALSGCSLSFNSGTGTGGGSGDAMDGGVFKSTNKGTGWEQMALIQGVGSQRSLAGVDIISLAMDPEDNKAIYAGSFDNGLFYSYDGGAGWQIAATLGKVSATDLEVDPANKCVIYAAVANKVFKSSDCSRTWAQAFFDNDLKLAITDIALDNYGGVFIGTSRGEIIKSSDRGVSWRVLDRFDNSVEKIIINPANQKILFSGTYTEGIYRSTDGGETWVSLSDKLKAFADSQRFRDLMIVNDGKASIFLATNYGLLKSINNGDTWSKIELITPEKEAKINAIAVNQKNANEIYYVTDTAFYRSLDGGKNWTSKKLPTDRAGAKLLLDPTNSNIIYLAAKKVKK